MTGFDRNGSSEERDLEAGHGGRDVARVHECSRRLGAGLTSLGCRQSSCVDVASGSAVGIGPVSAGEIQCLNELETIYDKEPTLEIIHTVAE